MENIGNFLRKTNMSSQDWVAIANKHLECPICFSPFKEPRNLHCGHKLCTDCLKKVLKNKEPGYIYSCPMDRKLFRIPPGGVNGFSRDYTTKHLVELLVGKAPENVLICQQHEEQYIILACKQCKVGVCSLCIAGLHQGHSFVDRETLYNQDLMEIEEKGGSLLPLFEESKTNLENIYANSRASYQKDLDKIDYMHEALKRELEKVVMRMKKPLKEKFQKCEEMKEAYDKKIGIVGAQIREFLPQLKELKGDGSLKKDYNHLEKEKKYLLSLESSARMEFTGVEYKVTKIKELGNMKKLLLGFETVFDTPQIKTKPQSKETKKSTNGCRKLSLKKI